MSYQQQPPFQPQTYGSRRTASPIPGMSYPPVQSPNRRPKWPWIVGGIMLAVIVGCVGLSLAGVFGAAKVAGSQRDKNAAAGQLGKPATDGNSQFTVTSVQCGVKQVGAADGQKAQGQFCLVSVSITNVGTSTDIFNNPSQTGYDAKGAQYSVDSGATVYANKDSSTFLEQINPGDTVRGWLVFDVPQGIKLASVVLHDSMFTSGVKVPLS